MNAVDPPDSAAEVVRLRAELAATRAALDTRRRRTEILRRVRAATGAVLVALAAFALVTSVVGLWAARTVLDTQRWTETVSPLPADPQVAAAVAEFSTAQVFTVLDVEQRLREALPPQAGFAVGPVVTQVRDQVRRQVEEIVRSDRFGALWTEVNRRAHRQALAVLQGTSAVVKADGDRIVIDLLPVVNQVLRDLSAHLPTVFGRQITLPDLGSGAIPDGLRTTVEQALGVTLPADFARFTVDDGGRLREAQEALETARRAVLLTALATVALLVLGFVVAPDRRRALLQFGVWLVVASAVVTVALRAWRADLEARVPEGVYRDGVHATVGTVTAVLRERGEQLLWCGVALAAVAYLVGPGRLPTRLRATAADAGRGVVRTARRAPQWTVAHLDPVRVGAVAVAVLAALLFASWTALLVLAVVLVGFEVAVTLYARSRRSSGAGEVSEPAVR